MADANFPGLMQGSEYYTHEPSERARTLFFYPIGCGRFYTTRDYHLDGCPNTGLLLIYIETGCGKLKTRLGEYDVNTKDFVMIDLTRPHDFTGICGMLWCRIDGATARKLYWTIRMNSSPVFKMMKDSPVPAMMETVLAEMKNPGLPREGMMSSEIYAIFAYLADTAWQLSEKEGSEPAIVQQAIRYIREHFAEKLSVPDIAAKFNVDQSHFSHDFKEHTGSSPYDFIINVRLDCAKVLLKTTDKTIQEVSLDAGFSSASLFSSTFKKRVGLTPLEFRKHHI